MRGDGKQEQFWDDTAMSALEEMEELRSKIQLRESDHKTYREWSLKEREKNESSITELREVNAKARIALQDSLDGDVRVIQTAYQDRRTDLLALLRHTARQAVDITDQRVCERAKALNNIRYERMSREKRLEDLRMLLREKEHLASKGPDQLASEQSIRRLENGIDKTRIKFETSKIISDQYEEIVRRYKQRIRTYPTAMDELSRTVKENKSELAELKKLMQHATEAKDQAKTDFHEYDKYVHEAKRNRDKQLIETKNEVEKRNEWFENKAEIRRPGHRFHFADTHAELKAQQELTQALERKTKVLTYEEAFNKLKETTGITDLSDFVETCGQQHKTREHLSQQAHMLESFNAKCTDERDKLLNDYKHMKYQGEAKLSQGELMLENMTEEIKLSNEKRDKIAKNTERQGKLKQEAGLAIHSIHDKLKDIRSPILSSHNIDRSSLNGLLLVCRSKLVLLMKQLHKEGASPTKMTDLLESQEFHDKVHDSLPESNIRISDVFSAEIDPLEDYGYDSQDNEDMLTRQDIKIMEQHFIENRTKPKKRKGKKRVV